VTIRQRKHVTSYCNLLAPIFDSRLAGLSFSKVQRVFIAESYLAFCSYLSFQNGFRYTVLYFYVTQADTIFSGELFRDIGSVQDRNRSSRTSVLIDDSLDCIRHILLKAGHFQRNII
jgi:hypothetical protein